MLKHGRRYGKLSQLVTVLIVQVLDRKRCGRAPANASPHDRPAAYFVVRVDSSSEWIPLHRIIDEDEKLLVKEFEWRFPRSEALPCKLVSAYPTDRYATPDDREDEESDDEVDLVLARELDEKFGFLVFRPEDSPD